MTIESRPPRAPHQPIPGERDPHNLTTREPGAVGGQFTGADIPPADHLPWLDRVTHRGRALPRRRPVGEIAEEAGGTLAGGRRGVAGAVDGDFRRAARGRPIGYLVRPPQS